jgi:DNA polymerase I-like protein with 3'-5' exonuclease and polymerase domains
MPTSCSSSITCSRRPIDERGLRKLYSEIELPLAGVLARMERSGVRIDRNELQRLSTMMETEIARLTADIHRLAGRPSTSARRSNWATCCSTT